MDKIYFNLSNPINLDISSDMSFLNNIYQKYPEFNLTEYQNINLFQKHINNISDLDENKLISFHSFFKKYPNFDILFYKIINYDLNYINDIEYIIHYFNIGHNENRISCLSEFIEKYKIDFIFIKKLYPTFINYTNIEIIKSIIKNISEYIISLSDFFKKYPNFNILFYKIFHSNNLFNDDIDYISYWYNFDKNNIK